MEGFLLRLRTQRVAVLIHDFFPGGENSKWLICEEGKFESVGRNGGWCELAKDDVLGRCESDWKGVVVL
jgi:hypothetical protein